RQPLAEVAARLQARARELVELARVQRADTSVRNRRRLERDQVVRRRRLHLKMLTSVVDVDRDTRVLQDVAICVPERRRLLEDLAREVRDLDTVDGGVEGRSVRRVADAKSNHE